MKFKFIKRSVYGRPLFFPSNESAITLLAIFPHITKPRKSLTQEQVLSLKELGLEIEVIADDSI